MRGDLVLNPRAKLDRVVDQSDKELVYYRIVAPSRDQGALETLVSSHAAFQTPTVVSPSLMDVLHRMHSGDIDIELDEDEITQLADMKLLIAAGDVPAVVEYVCLLDADEDGLPAPQPGSYVVNPAIVITPNFVAPPHAIDSQLFASSWNRAYDVAWVRDPRSGGTFPYHLSRALHTTLLELVDGRPIHTLASATVQLLEAAHILLSAEVPTNHLYSRTMTRAMESYRLNGYALIPDVIPRLHLDSLCKYYDNLVREGYLPLGDRQVGKRYYRHNEDVSRYFHIQFTAMYQSIIGADIKPSYCYFASYVEGAELERHVDRAQCEFTASTQIDFTSNGTQLSGWKLYLEENISPRETFALNLGRGDTVIYRGRELAHYRDVLPEGRSSTSMFLHYVHSDYSGPLA